ncbi:unnamed protein product [Polarella glacialis]|uniref:Uncharacterized protein n=1 Tax=Polarella glacialis TaxID=89957 RepID=A0A813JJ51_POLGL|nr:unnamed protein product [Polarella glacialis]
MLSRQLTVSALLVSDFSVLSKMFRFIFAIGTSNRGHIMIWNVVFAISGIYRGLTFRCGMIAGNADVQWQLQTYNTYKAAVSVVGTELLCSALIFVVWLAMEKFMAMLISAILDAQEAENEKAAAQRMLAVLCDSQMMLDSELRISGRHETKYAKIT